MNKSERTVDEFLASLDDDRKADLIALDEAISGAMAGTERVLYEGKFWGGTDQEIIGYGELETVRSDKSTVRWFVIGLALQKNYISVYISAVEDRQYLSEKYGKDLGKVTVGKSNINFKTVDDIDLEKLVELVRRARAATAES